MELLAIFLIIILSALVSGSESAFFSLKNKDLIDLQKSEYRFAHLIVRLLEHPKQLLASILITNTIVNISVAILAADVTNSLLPHSNEFVHFMVEVIAVTFTLVLFGEVTPKVYAAQYSLRFANFMAYPIMLMNNILYPLSIMLIKTTNLIEKRMDKKGHNLLLDEIKQAIEITTEAGSSQEEKKILKGIISFSNTYVKQIMTSRIDVVAHDISTPLSQLIAYINENRYSRVPVYSGTLDKVEGLLYIKDLLPYLGESDDFDWKMLLRQPYFVPETKMIDDLLKEFQLKKVHMALVIDEYGGTAGLITMEDILEEIVGDIHDEFDEDELYYSMLDDNNCVFTGKTSLTDVVKVMNLEGDVFDKIRDEAETIGGLVVELCEKIPAVGEKVYYQEFEFTVESADRKRVQRVKVTRNNVRKVEESD